MHNLYAKNAWFFQNHVEVMQEMNVINNCHVVVRCAGFQDALLWVLSKTDYHAYKKKKEEENEFDRL